MAPQTKAAQKRAGQEQKATKAHKKAKSEPRNPHEKAVMDAIAASEELPASCSAMLLAMLPGSLGVPADRRNGHQNRAVEMVREVLDKLETQLQEGVQAEERAIEEMEGSKESLKAKTAEAEEVVAAAAAVVATKKEADLAADEAASAAAQALKAAQAEEKAGKEKLEATAAELQTVESAMEDHFRKLCGDAWLEESATTHSEALMATLKTLDSTDDSLLIAAPTIFKKAPADRTDFDAVVISQVETCLSNQLKKLNEIKESGGETLRSLSAAAEEAAKANEAALDAKIFAANALADAEGEAKEAAAKLKEAKNDEAALQPAARKAAASKDEKERLLTAFQEGTLASFTALQVKTSTDVSSQAGA